MWCFVDEIWTHHYTLVSKQQTKVNQLWRKKRLSVRKWWRQFFYMQKEFSWSIILKKVKPLLA